MEFSDLPIPEEMKTLLEGHIIRQQMGRTSFQHDLQRLFQELSKDHLLTLRHLFDHLAQTDGRYAAFLEGVAATTLHHRFNVCGSCGVNHDEELLDEGRASKKPDQEERLFDDSGSPTAEALPEEPTHEDYLRECEKYNVEPYELGGSVICKGCGQVYVSLADRMIKPPGIEHCEGCVHKTKFG